MTRHLIVMTLLAAAACAGASQRPAASSTPSVQLADWTRKLDGGDVVFVGGTADRAVFSSSSKTSTKLTAIALSDGAVLWMHEVSGVATAAIDSPQAFVLVASREEVRSLSLEDGTERWTSRVTPLGGTRALTVASDATVACVVAGVIACLDATTGREQWRKPFDEPKEMLVPPRVIGGLLVVVSDSSIASFLLTNGGQRWWRTLPDKHIVGAELVDGMFYVTAAADNGRAGHVFALSLQSGELRWTSERILAPRGPATVTADTVYVVSQYVLYGFDLLSGLRVSRAPLPHDLFGDRPRLARARDAVLASGASVTAITPQGAATYAGEGLPAESHVVRSWGNFEVTGDKRHLIAWDTPSDGPVTIARYAFDGPAWTPVPSAFPEQPLVLDVRDRRIKSLRERRQLPACYGTDRRVTLPYSAIIHAALVGNNAQVMHELIAEGVLEQHRLGSDVEVADALGLTEVADELRALNQRSQKDVELKNAIRADDVAAVTAQLAAGARANGANAFNTKRSCEDVPLAATRSIGVAEALITAGAAPNLVDGEGRTPLDWQIAAKNEPLIKLLRSRGAKTSAELNATK